MDEFVFIISYCFGILAIGDLIVGVSNDAVNFLNSAVGSKAISLRTVMILAGLGVALGALFSSGLMEVARKGIFNPSEFYFDEIILIFTAVMLTDILLFRFFQFFWRIPTSTTVSIVFELLGAAVFMSLIKINNIWRNFRSNKLFINTSKAIQIIFGIILSIVCRFNYWSYTVSVQWICSLFLTYDFEKKTINVKPYFRNCIVIYHLFYTNERYKRHSMGRGNFLYNWGNED